MSFWSKSADHGKRDDAIRVNSYTTVRRRQGVPHEVFTAYWRDVHGPLCSRLPGLGWYVQHHFDRERDGHLWTFADGIAPLTGHVLDGIVEIGFASETDQATFQKASPLLFSDEQNVFDETVAYDLPRGSTTLVDRQQDPTPNAPERADRLHLHFHPVKGQEKALAAYLTDDVATPFAKQDAVLKVRLHLPEPHDNRVPNPPAPGVKHAVDLPRATLAFVEIAFESPLERRRFLASDAFQRTLRLQPTVVASASAFAVSGVYTFVRDGQLTTAGLRGSRAAELITRLGALNQLSPEVERLVRTGSL